MGENTDIPQEAMDEVQASSRKLKDILLANKKLIVSAIAATAAVVLYVKIYQSIDETTYVYTDEELTKMQADYDAREAAEEKSHVIR